MTSEQRELLERAAKAVGMEVIWDETLHRLYHVNGDHVIGEWHPPTDHGDRYRLARACKMIIDFDCGQVIGGGEGTWETFDFTPGDDESEGWAVVRAAAATFEVGK